MGFSFSGIWWLFLFDVRCTWRHNLTSFSCFQTNVLAKFVDIICIFFYTHSPYFMCHCIEYKLSTLQVRISGEDTPNATPLQVISAKISGCALKQWNKTHSSLRQSNLQLQIQAALMSRPIRVVEHRKCAGGWLAHTPVCKIKSYKTTQELRMRIKHARRLSLFCYVQKSSKLLVFLFPCWYIIKCWNASLLTTAIFELVQQFYHAT